MKTKLNPQDRMLGIQDACALNLSDKIYPQLLRHHAKAGNVKAVRRNGFFFMKEIDYRDFIRRFEAGEILLGRPRVRFEDLTGEIIEAKEKRK